LSVDYFHLNQVMVAPKQVYVLLFNARTENEGIHTLQINDQNVVLMFESEDDAIRFGGMLEAQDFPSPSVEALETEEIEEFCQSAGYECQFVETGMLALPPETNVEKTNNPMITYKMRRMPVSFFPCGACRSICPGRN